MNESTADAARKRRIAMRNQKRSSSTEDDPESNKRPRSSEIEDSSSVVEVIVEPVSSKPRPHITGIKKQSRYEPGVPMTREELKKWRKEARRVRNRESAAMSRKKNRERITELEIEVDEIKTKYAAALKMIIDLERSRKASDCASFTPPALRQDLMELRGSISRSASPEGHVQTVSPPQSPSFPSSVVATQDLLFGTHPHDHGHSLTQDVSSVAQHHHDFHKYQQHQHINMISRPIASKIPPGADVAENSVGHDETIIHGISCHFDDRDNIFMMKMMNEPHEPLPFADCEWQHGAEQPVDTITEYTTSSMSDNSSSCGSSHSDDCIEDFLQDQHPSVAESHNYEDTDLGEFLRDTFENVDVMAAMEDMPELAVI
ncbi:bZIP transcription factor [Nitzschia inconspicua]|uniref:BZIP transcription factor n=1 Tax=Nitzschia inconspicua TaxID=303405 RepID=A0A9K3PWZ7_9STRA|nr:bZIP transcription factor [Nitzschia inconspicua]